ncbi:CDP-alcohol phosphatidyltransferase family protein [Pseudochryseolinea flava]|uniref:CDP-alcohol phosphatidyltransferase family protein n=1 Tax=Pseudochryseolinea flava TaxID=2059302 RepID=A0A364Y316_9BACT|nr:CDP-alcohol phosphatidyltransferase family protein [Pseudochryseolinea flava]RAW00370.1 CDP-alcohol phosphatidyltransferase family protein [Pseudochryseolinea flava]
MTQPSQGRRPIASRDSGWAKNTASFLAKQNVSPNTISILSIVFAAISMAAFYLDATSTTFVVHAAMMTLAIVGIQGRLIMNLLDGMVAVEHDKKSAVGGIYNEVPDRVSDTFTLFGLIFLVKTQPYGSELVYLAIALSITTAYIRTLGASLQVGHHFLGPMAKQHRMALVTGCCVIAIWYPPIFYYALIGMNIGLLITCYRRLACVYTLLNDSSNAKKE